MARLLRIESCSECKHCESEFAFEYIDVRFRCELLDPDVTGRDWLENCESGIDPDCPLEEERRWIPVGERLPTERGTYEIAMPPLSPNEQHPHILVCEWAPAYGFHEEVCGTTFVYSADILAWRPWQPLPALPEEASDGDATE